jgi:hypothetical protein
LKISYTELPSLKVHPTLRLPGENADLDDEQELFAFQKHLREPWPKTKADGRPHIPTAILTDIKAEAHQGCAICGHMDNGEVAHIDPVATSLNNSPDNLILLCPNHHTKYDYGFKPSSNLTMDVILAAKTVKRETRRRIMRAEANATKMLTAIAILLKNLESKQKKDGIAEDETKVYLAESRQLLAQIGEITAQAQEAGTKDGEPESAAKLIAGAAPRLSKLASGSLLRPTEVRTAARRAAEIVDDIFGDLDEEDCPHCGGQGTVGLVGHLCAYCRGACFVSSDEVERYDRSEIDEHDCPRCGGRGQTGLAGDLCTYCKGACVLPKDQVEDYNPDDIDEVDCPRCEGRGLTGLAGDFCAFCKGSCLVPKKRAAQFRPTSVDEVDCPHCNGRGQTGLAGDYCAYCRGSCVVSRKKAHAYDREKLDEVDCPHCHGRGQTGLAGDFCAYCGGSCKVSKSKADSYAPDNVDEVECPHCNGSGQRGIAGDLCKFCHGAQVVSRDRAKAYLNRRRPR